MGAGRGDRSRPAPSDAGVPMHEMALTHDVVDFVLAESARHGGAEIVEVRLTVGEARDIVTELFEGLFHHLTRGTAAAQAAITIERVPFRVRCRRCGELFGLNVHDESTWSCPACGTPRDYELASGMEFTIDSIEFAASLRSA